MILFRIRIFRLENVIFPQSIKFGNQKHCINILAPDLKHQMTRLKEIVEVDEESKALWKELRYLRTSVMTTQFKNISTFCNNIPALRTKNGYELVTISIKQFSCL